MDSQSKAIMYDTLADQVEVQTMHALIIQINPTEENVFKDWLNNLIDTADVNVNEEDYRVDGGDIEWNAFRREEYNQTKAWIKVRVNMVIDEWIAIEQTLVVN